VGSTVASPSLSAVDLHPENTLSILIGNSEQRVGRGPGSYWLKKSASKSARAVLTFLSVVPATAFTRLLVRRAPRTIHVSESRSSDRSRKGRRASTTPSGPMCYSTGPAHATPNVFSTAARADTRLRLADRHRPIHSLVISNVPGPDAPLYMGGPESWLHILSALSWTAPGFNITAMSYRGVINWGLTACTESVPSWDRSRDAIPEALYELRSAAELGRRLGWAARQSGRASFTSRSRGAPPRRRHQLLSCRESTTC